MASNKCVNCGAELVFIPGKAGLHCKNCGSVFPIAKKRGGITRYVYDLSYNPDKNRTEETKYYCPACGSNIMAGRDKPVNICATCGNTSLEEKTRSVIAPDGIIPFEIDKNKAGEIFRKFIRSRKFAPSDLAQMARLQKIIGVYTPVWKFDFEAHTEYSYVGVKKYVDKNYEEQKSHHPVSKIKEERFEGALISANKNIDNETLKEIGDYDFSKAVPYSKEYVQGFYMTDTNNDIHVVYDKFTDDIAARTRAALEKRAGEDYDYIKGFAANTEFNGALFNHIGVPVYANHYVYKGKSYHCYINGQTGKVTGKTPKSFWKIFGLVCGVALGIGIIALLLLKFF